MAISKSSSSFIPKTIAGWVVFIILNLSAITVAFSGIKEISMDIYYLVTGGSKIKALEEANQNRLWIKNKECYKNTSPYHFVTEHKEKLSILLCQDTGDIYVELTPKDPKEDITNKWIEIPRKDKTAFNFSFITTLTAETKRSSFITEDNSENKIICKEVTDEYAIEIKELSNGSCLLVRKWFNGKIESYVVSCNKSCT